MSYQLQLSLVLGVFVAIITLVSQGVSLFYALSSAAILIAAIMGLSPAELLGLVGKVFLDHLTLDVIVAVVVIGWLGALMNESGSLHQSSKLLQQLVKDFRVVAAVIPMIVGVLMVPGGAILSAPSVKLLTGSMNLRPSRQAAINLVFRHVGQIAFPASASLLMLTSMAGVSLARQILYQLPLAVFIGLFAFQYYFASESCEIQRGPNPRERLCLLKNLLAEISPILIVLGIFILTQQISLALGLGTAWAFIQHRFSFREALSILQSKSSFENAFFVASTLLIRAILQYQLAKKAFVFPALQTSFIPLVILIAPCLVGFFTGSVMASVSLATPLLLPLVGTYANLHVFCALVFMSAFMGYMVSPIHLCLSLTAKYYNVSLGEIYRDMWMPIGAFLACVIVLSLLFTAL